MTPTERCIEIALSELDADIDQSCDEMWHELTLSGLSEDMRSAWMQRFYADMREVRDRHEARLSEIFDRRNTMLLVLPHDGSIN
jgi:hypothetical protein